MEITRRTHRATSRLNSLVQKLKQSGYHLDHEGGGNFRLRDHGGLIIKNNYWYQHSTQEKGYAYQLLKKLGVDTKQKFIPFPIDFHKKSPILKEYSLRMQGRNIIDYLVYRRMIDSKLILLLIRTKLIGQENHYICFYGYDKYGKIQCISKRAFNKIPHFQQIETLGSDKRYSFSLPSYPYSKTVILCESPIDALSIACMENQKYHNGYFTTKKIALCGNHPGNIAPRINKLKPDKIYLAFDNDPIGKTITRKVYSQVHRIAKTTIISYPHGKDPNDWWIHRRNNLI